MPVDKKMTAPVIYSIAVSSPRGLAAPAARRPPRLARHRRGPRPHLALRHGVASPARLARFRRGLLRQHHLTIYPLLHERLPCNPARSDNNAAWPGWPGLRAAARKRSPDPGKGSHGRAAAGRCCLRLRNNC